MASVASNRHKSIALITVTAILITTRRDCFKNGGRGELVKFDLNHEGGGWEVSRESG